MWGTGEVNYPTSAETRQMWGTGAGGEVNYPTSAKTRQMWGSRLNTAVAKCIISRSPLGFKLPHPSLRSGWGTPQARGKPVSRRDSSGGNGSRPQNDNSNDKSGE